MDRWDFRLNKRQTERKRDVGLSVRGKWGRIKIKKQQQKNKTSTAVKRAWTRLTPLPFLLSTLLLIDLVVQLQQQHNKTLLQKKKKNLSFGLCSGCLALGKHLSYVSYSYLQPHNTTTTSPLSDPPWCANEKLLMWKKLPLTSIQMWYRHMRAFLTFYSFFQSLHPPLCPLLLI